MSEFFLNFIFGWVPWWGWAAIALLALGGVYKWVGWQGMLALAFGVVAFFGYREGYNDRRLNKPPLVPTTPIKPPTPLPRPRKRRTLQDILNGKTNS